MNKQKSPPPFKKNKSIPVARLISNSNTPITDIPIATPLILENPYTIHVHTCRRCYCNFNAFTKDKGTAAFFRCNTCRSLPTLVDDSCIIL